jgi:hypothetical protein
MRNDFFYVTAANTTHHIDGTRKNRGGSLRPGIVIVAPRGARVFLNGTAR